MQLDSEFHEMRGRRNVITFISDSEKDPRALGFLWWTNSLLVFLFMLTWRKMQMCQVMKRRLKDVKFLKAALW